ncbi:tripartite tricarboxylate transporter TctB family protein [Granulosicoccus sp. 3-233]|uniref:tripartite tricarboxylate transporter TctB family protein n=1 Tax=Granulosicoccus sp. 3-233 TaxID=3417969 RepID=UPI003D33AA91
MPRMSEFGANIWSAPGIVPGMVGLLIAIMGGVLFFRSRKTPGSAASATARNGAWRRVLTVLVLCVIFAGMLVGRIPFAIAAFIFIFVFILLFDREDRAIETGSKTLSPARVALAFGVAAAASVTITWVFEDIFLVRLP